jgi:hypothetical protein
MSEKTLSEQAVEEFCNRHHIEFRRIKVARKQGNRRPDYAIKVGGGWCILEVKEIAPTDEDNSLLEELSKGIIKGRWVAPGKRLRGPIRSGEHQLRKFSARKLPTVICLLDTTVSFHVEDFHISAAMLGDETLYFGVSPETGTGQFLGSAPGRNAMLRRDERTTVSAVAVLRQPSSGSEVVVDLYHNPYAAVRIEAGIAAPFVEKQIGVGLEAREREGPTWFDVRDNPEYEEFWRDPEAAQARVVKEILDEGNDSES